MLSIKIFVSLLVYYKERKVSSYIAASDCPQYYNVIMFSLATASSKNHDPNGAIDGVHTDGTCFRYRYCSTKYLPSSCTVVQRHLMEFTGGK